MGEQNLHRFKAESGTGELMRGSFCEGEGFFPELPVEQNAAILRFDMGRRNESVGEILLKSPWWISAVLPRQYENPKDNFRLDGPCPVRVII